MHRALVAAAVADRLAAARDWLETHAPGEELLIISATREAGSEIVRRAVAGAGRPAIFGWHRATLGRLAAELTATDGEGSAPPVVPLTRLGGVAVVARSVQKLQDEGRLGRFATVADRPGFARSVASTLEEFRLEELPSEALTCSAPDLAAIAAHYEDALDEQRLADRATLLVRATEWIVSGSGHRWIGLPLLLLDVSLSSRAEASLVAALAARAPETLATVAAGDAMTLAHLERANFEITRETSDTTAATVLAQLQAGLFEGEGGGDAVADDTVVVFSAPGENRECVEIARRLLQEAEQGVAFDEMAVLLRSVEEYRPHLEEAFARAGIPAYFSRGAVRPDPAGRAFLALLACAAQGLSAARFAEYLSLAQVPQLDPVGQPPPAAPGGERWVKPDEEWLPVGLAESQPPAQDEDEAASEDASRSRGVRAPRRWEELLVESAVIGGRDRWGRRLVGLRRELELEVENLEADDEAIAGAVRARIAELDSLRAFALPLLDDLAALPARERWGRWLDDLSALATRSLRRPERVLAVLAELAPMAEVGPVDLSEVRLVLSRRLLEAATPPPASRHGRVFVGGSESARGLAFDVVCVPGLAEKLFPRQIREDPILLDRIRRALNNGLATNETRLLGERLALRLAAGAARRRLILSYPRVDAEKGRPRVPSFYALEALRAAEGRLPGFDELASRAESVTSTRAGWPAPEDPREAIDDAEHDLALLDRIMRLDESESVGTARYLLEANPHLGRALRFRARRWLRRWTGADGLVEPSPPALAALGVHRLPKRSYSPTALENYAACPYRFFLQAIHRLAVREIPAGIEEMSPLQRGSLVHDVQFALFGRLEADGLLPVIPGNLEQARARLEDVLAEVAERHHEELAPAIERVWAVGIEEVRVDLREWLRRMSEDASSFVPWRFELAFGLGRALDRDRRSRLDAVPLATGLRLRGSIDLIERDGRGRLRVIDHKTGKTRFPEGGVIAGGRMLQPVLYALAAEAMFPEADVVEGRLSYCTMSGGFQIRTVRLDEQARAGAREVTEAVAEALDSGFLPAAPDDGACRFCDYALVCGPYEEVRVRRKPPQQKIVTRLRRLREAP